MDTKFLWITILPLILVFSSKVVVAQDLAKGKRLYQTYCSNCHGVSGKGDGVAAQSLPQKPVDHTDGKVMSQFSDKYLGEIISKGGSGVGKSPFMPAWGSLLKAPQIQDVIGYMRSLSTPPAQSAP